MTTSVTVRAHCSSEKEVEIQITDGDLVIESLTIQDGEQADRVVFDGREITVKEVVKK